jgi:hypothetical protein
MTYLNFALSIVLNGIVLSILGIIVERVFIKSGLVRGDTLGVIVGDFLVGFIMSIADPGRDYLLFWLGFGALVPVSINRIDLFASLTKGRW